VGAGSADRGKHWAIGISGDLKIDIVRRGAAAWVEIHGELDVATAPLLDAKLGEAEATDARLIVIDIADVPFIDSSGLRALLQAQARTQGNSGRLRITEGSPQARRLFELAGVLETLPFAAAAELEREAD
jgi:stage II sporulation protein AA (anti-sigma F factor antagonist)